MTDLDQWAVGGFDSRLRALEQRLAELEQELADERRERIAADRCIQRMQQDREWRREVA